MGKNKKKKTFFIPCELLNEIPEFPKEGLKIDIKVENDKKIAESNKEIYAKDLISMQKSDFSHKEKSIKKQKKKEEEKTFKSLSYVAAEDLAAEYLIDNFVVGNFQGTPYIKLDDTFNLIYEESIGVIIMKCLPKQIRKSLSSNHFKAVANRLSYMLKSRNLKLHIPEGKIVFNNGIYDILSEDWVEAKNDELFLVKVNADFYPDEKIPTPVFDQFLETSCRNNKQIKKRLLEFMAYQLITGAPAKAFFVLGTASNSGKSLIADFYKELLGAENICAIPISNFGTRFSPSQLCTHVATFSMESNQEALNSTTTRNIKLFTGHDTANFEIKGGKEWAQRNLDKIVFGTNHQICTKEKDIPFYERMVIVPFLYSTPIHLRDDDLLDKLLAERNGIVKKLMKILKKLILNKFQFSYCLAAEQMRAEWCGCSDFSIREFINRTCILDPNTQCATHTLHTAFNQFCDIYSLPKAKSEKAFISVLYDFYGLESNRWTDEHGNQVRGPVGITLKPEFTDNVEEF